MELSRRNVDPGSDIFDESNLLSAIEHGGDFFDFLLIRSGVPIYPTETIYAVKRRTLMQWLKGEEPERTVVALGINDLPLDTLGRWIGYDFAIEEKKWSFDGKGQVGGPSSKLRRFI